MSMGENRMIFEYNGRKPNIGKNVFIAPTAAVIGDVNIEDGVSIWYGVVIRGDRAPITVGKNSNIQDNSTVHADAGKPTVIGENVTVGHNAVVHACTIEDSCLIGINAVVLTDGYIKTGSIVAAGAVVRNGQIVGPYQLVAGIPAVIKKELAESSSQNIIKTANSYVKLARDYMPDGN